MTNGQSIIKAVALRTGIDLQYIEDTARNLAQAGEWPSDPAKALTRLLLPLMAEADPKDAASVARHYYDLTADDYPGRAGEKIEAMARSLLAQARTDFSRWAYQSRIEVHTTATPGVKILTPCTDGSTFEITYADPVWHTAGVRSFNTLAGIGLFKITADILKAELAYV